MKIKLKTGALCSFCKEPIQDLSTATLFWRDAEPGEAIFGVAHSGKCEAAENWKRFRHSTNLHRLVVQPEEMCAFRKYLTVKIRDGELTLEAVKEGLELFLAEVPPEFFDLVPGDYGRPRGERPA